MSSKALNVIVLLLAVQSIYAAAIDISEYYDTYYDPKNNNPAIYVPENTKADMEKMSFTGISCSCENLVCNCCTGIRLRKFNFNNDVCGVVKYESQNKVINATLTFNQEEGLPIPTSEKFRLEWCVGVPHFHSVKVCVGIKGFSVINDELKVNADMETYVPQEPTLVLHFNDMLI